MKASLLLQLGKEAQDVIQAWIDPEMTKGRLTESKDLGVVLWNLGEQYPEILENKKAFFMWVAQGATLETLREYFSGDFVEYDLNV